jgi:hypothetical protein
MNILNIGSLRKKARRCHHLKMAMKKFRSDVEYRIHNSPRCRKNKESLQIPILCILQFDFAHRSDMTICKRNMGVVRMKHCR